MSEDKERFEEIIGEIGELVEEAISLLPDSDVYRNGGYPVLVDKAKSYWYGHIKTALDDDHEFIGRSMCNMQDTLEEWRDLDGVSEDQSSLPQFNTQSDWDDYVASKGINQYEEDSE